MQRYVFGCVAAAAVAGACTRADVGESRQDKDNDKDEVVIERETRILDDDTRLGEPIAHANLTLVPMVARKPAAVDTDFLTLDEAFEENLIEIREKESESVNELQVENKSSRPLFVMSGEVILGGKQDRVIGKDTIIPPKEVATLPVYCVEKGRWAEGGGQDGRKFYTAKALAHTDLRLTANYSDQTEVWNEVSAKNSMRQKHSGTDTYRRVAVEKDTDQAIAAYQQSFAAALASAPDKSATVGFVVVMNGEIAGVESFASPQLFSKLQEKLLRSYYVQSIDLPAPADPAALQRVPTPEQVRTFLAEAAKAPAQPVIENVAGGTEQVLAAPDSTSSKVFEKKDGKKREIYKSTYKRKKKP